MNEHKVRRQGFDVAVASKDARSRLADALAKAKAKALDLRQQVKDDLEERARTIDGIKDAKVKAAARGGHRRRESEETEA